MHYASPAIDKTAFNCPHCGALAKQFWFSLHAEELKKDEMPFRVTEERAEKFEADTEDMNEREELKALTRRIAIGAPLIQPVRSHCNYFLHNVSLSQCYNCDEVSIWISSAFAWPQRGEGPPPNPDLPEQVLKDYEEASKILHLSPRGACAILRLAIQRLCIYLGEEGKKLNEDIASLVKKGLPPQVQQALDVVRVTGNNAVHPGRMDLSDDPATADSLLRLLNVIGERMITGPKHIQELYDSLPETALKQIEERDGHRDSTA
jgi:hypothetical protein